MLQGRCAHAIIKINNFDFFQYWLTITVQKPRQRKFCVLKSMLTYCGTIKIPSHCWIDSAARRLQVQFVELGCVFTKKAQLSSAHSDPIQLPRKWKQINWILNSYIFHQCYSNTVVGLLYLYRMGVSWSILSLFKEASLFERNAT